MNLHIPLRQRAMTLVEVVLALGIIAFAIIPIIGLLSMSMQTSVESQKDTAIALAARHMIGQLRMRGDFADPSTLSTSVSFTQDGIYQEVANHDTTFSCQLVCIPRLDNTNFADVTMTFRWPPATTNPSNVQTLQASFANF